MGKKGAASKSLPAEKLHDIWRLSFQGGESLKILFSLRVPERTGDRSEDEEEKGEGFSSFFFSVLKRLQITRRSFSSGAGEEGKKTERSQGLD